MKEKKRALVVEGGAMRSIYSIGILDTLIKSNYYDFDMCIGVSAGSTALASYLAGMHKRSYRVTTEYSTRKNFISKRNFIKGGHYMDLDWLWNYCEIHDPLDIDLILKRKINFFVGVTSASTGNSEYLSFTKNNGADLLKASCALPIAYKNPVKVEDFMYFDGGISDPIPIEEAIKLGANEIIVIRSRKKEFEMENKKNKVQKFMLRKYSKINESLSRRSTRYNDSIKLIRKEDKNVKIIEINPPGEFRSSRFTTDKEILNLDYELGIKSGYELLDILKL
ncbi:MAG: patatin family protein [Acidaminobacteraceae bacterium]